MRYLYHIQIMNFPTNPRIVFGGIASTFVHATATEAFLMGRSMADHDMFIEVNMCILINKEF